MRITTISKIATKNLWSHKLRTLLTVAGVAIGIGAIIFLVSFGYGLEKLVTQQVANFNAFTVIDVPSASNKTIDMDDVAIDKIAGFGNVVKVAPVGSIAGKVKKEDSTSTSETVVIGATADYWKMADTIADKGNLPKEGNEVLVNQPVLTLMGENENSIIGKTIKLDLLVPPEMASKPNDGKVKLVENIELKVVGYSKSDKESMVMVPLDLLKKNGMAEYSAMKIKVKEKENVDAVRRQIEGIGFDTEYVGDTVNQIQQVFSLFRVVMGAFGLIALIVAALGTFNTLTISLLERTREVGLFKALGMRNKDIYKLFLAESIYIGIFGGILGLLIGLGIGDILNSVLAYLADKSGADKISVFITPGTFVAWTALFSLFVGFLTGWYPARRAVKISALDALRNE